jgi:hypothetical protein
MSTVFLEPVSAHWLSGTPQEVKQAEETLSRNWDTLKQHIKSAQRGEVDSPLAACKREQDVSIVDSDQPDSESSANLSNAMTLAKNQS